MYASTHTTLFVNFKRCERCWIPLSQGTENIHNSNTPPQPHLLVTGSKNEKNLYDNNKKMNFHFNRQSPSQHWLSCHPALLKAFRPFTGMSQKSIAIYSLFGPRATKVNNTVTSSLPAEHGHKTALPLKYNLTQLFIYAGAADHIGFHRGQILQQSHTEGVKLLYLSQTECWALN